MRLVAEDDVVSGINPCKQGATRESDQGMS